MKKLTTLIVLIAAVSLMLPNRVEGFVKPPTPEGATLEVTYGHEVAKLPKALENLLNEEIIKRYMRKVGSYRFIIANHRISESDGVINLSVYTKTRNQVTIQDFVEDNTFIIDTDEKGNWRIRRLDNTNPQTVQELPDSITSAIAKDRINKLLGGDKVDVAPLTMQAQAIPLGYKFPWEAGQTFYFAQSWHDAFRKMGVDLGTTGPNRKFLAPINGTITFLHYCPETVHMRITDDNGMELDYLHIDRDTLQPGIQLHADLIQGQVIGNFEIGAFNEECGYSSQNEISSHIHWQLPTYAPFTVDGWTITHPNRQWVRGSQTVFESFYPTLLTSTNVASYGSSSCSGSSAVLQGVVVNSGNTFTCEAQTITVKPETHFYAGSDVRLSAR